MAENLTPRGKGCRQRWEKAPGYQNSHLWGPVGDLHGGLRINLCSDDTETFVHSFGLGVQSMKRLEIILWIRDNALIASGSLEPRFLL